MKRWIFLLGASLMLTGCSTSVSVSDVGVSSLSLGSGMNLGYAQEKGLYINDDMKKVISEINKLNDEYSVDDNRDFRYAYLYIDMDHNLESIRDITIGNQRNYQEGYFDELIKILDQGLAEGLEEYILEMTDKNLEIDESIIEKIGRTVVYVQNQGGEENHINIKINFLDLEDEYYKDVFDRVSNGKYILDNLVMGEKLNLMELINFNNSHYGYYYTNVDIRYNMFLQDKDIEKVNILIQKKNDPKFKDEDMEVFINLLNSMELNEGEKDLLVEEYKGLLEEKLKNKKIDLANYRLLIKGSKGSSYSGRGKSLVCFSIERK